jgi:hypothetical protein
MRRPCSFKNGLLIRTATAEHVAGISNCRNKLLVHWRKKKKLTTKTHHKESSSSPPHHHDGA